MSKVRVLVGTKKGAFILNSDAKRQKWDVTGPLFGGWEMNWLGYNYGHDIQLPGAQRGRVGFLMYPQCETAEGRLDCLDPDTFKYQITTREITLA